MPHGLQDKVEVAGICCTALEVTRYTNRAKVVGPLSRQLFFIRTGIADVIVTDEQCIRTDVPIEAAKVGTAVIATSDKVCYGLDDVTKKEADEIVNDMVEQGKQTLILDPDKAAEVAVKVALELAPKRNKVLVKPEAGAGAWPRTTGCAICAARSAPTCCRWATPSKQPRTAICSR